MAGLRVGKCSESEMAESARVIGVAFGNLAQFIIQNPCLGCVLAWLHSPGGVHKLQDRLVAQRLGVCCSGVYMGLGLNNYAILITIEGNNSRNFILRTRSGVAGV